MLNFSNVKAVTIPQGEVKSIHQGSTLLWKKARLPLEYQEVEWVQSHNTEYIDTGLIPTTGLSFDCKFQCNNTKAAAPGFGNIFGSRVASGNKELQLTLYGSGSIGVGVRTDNLGFNTTAIHRITYDGTNKVNIDGSERTINVGTFDGNIYHIALFGVWNGSAGVQQLESSKIYSCKFGNVRDFVPCYRRTDGVVGMYDLCGSICPLTNSPFYINAGTGTFAKGADVN